MKSIEFVRSLTMAVALAASISAFAVGKPQVFDVRMVLKTTVAQQDRMNNADNPFLGEDAETVVYREPKTVTWHGLIWGVGSCAIAGRWDTMTDAQEQTRVGGCILWDDQTKSVTYLADGTDLTDEGSVPSSCFGWQFFNVIGQNGRLCEGVWSATQYGAMCDEEGVELFAIVGSGFGTVTLAGSSDELTDNSRVESIAGDMTGWMRTPSIMMSCDDDVCCDYASAWDYCSCDDFLDETMTAVCGTWVIKYNPFYSHQYGKVTSICETSCFAGLSAVSNVVSSVEPAVRGE